MTTPSFTPPAKQPRRGRKICYWVLGIFTGLIVLGAIFGEEPPAEKDKAAAAKATPTPKPAEMPRLVGETAATAQKEDDDDDQLVLAWAKDPGKHADTCRIVRQSVPAGDPVTAPVKVRCAIRVPASLKGSSARTARTTLKDRGLKTKIANLPANGSTSGCRVRSWTPTQAGPRETVALKVKCPKPKPKPTPDSAPPTLDDAGSDDSNSSPSYAGQTCTEIGHSFTVPPGSDPDHDADGDGLACESQ